MQKKTIIAYATSVLFCLTPFQYVHASVNIEQAQQYEGHINRLLQAGKITEAREMADTLQSYITKSNNPLSGEVSIASIEDISQMASNSLKNIQEFAKILLVLQGKNMEEYQKAFGYFKAILPQNNLELLEKIFTFLNLGEIYDDELIALKSSINPDNGIGLIPKQDSNPYITAKALDLFRTIKDNTIGDKLMSYLINDGTWSLQTSNNAVLKATYTLSDPWQTSVKQSFEKQNNTSNKWIESLLRSWDTFHMIYTQLDGLDAGNNAQIKLLYTQQKSGEWSTPVVIAQHPYSSTLFHSFSELKTIEKAGVVHIVYADKQSSSNWEASLDQTEVFYAQIKDNTLVTLKQVSYDNTYSYNPDIQVDDQNNAYIIWKQGYSWVNKSGEEKLNFITYSTVNQTLSKEMLVATGALYPSIGYGDNTLFVEYRKDNAFSFTPFDTLAQKWQTPTIIPVAGSFENAVIFKRTWSTSYDIFAKKFDATQVLVPYTLSQISFDGVSGNILAQKSFPLPDGELQKWLVLQKSWDVYHIVYTHKIGTTNYLFYTDSSASTSILMIPNTLQMDQDNFFISKSWDVFTVDYGGYENENYSLFMSKAIFTPTVSAPTMFIFPDVKIDWVVSLQELKVTFTLLGYKFSFGVGL